MWKLFKQATKKVCEYFSNSNGLIVIATMWKSVKHNFSPYAIKPQKATILFLNVKPMGVNNYN